jgi:excisionase family DNA binding protein
MQRKECFVVCLLSFSTREAAQELGVRPVTLQRWIATGEIKVPQVFGTR